MPKKARIDDACLQGHEDIPMTRTPPGYWEDPDRLLRTIQTLTEELGTFPTLQQIREAGFDGLANAISNRLGGINAVRKMLGEPPKAKDWSQFEEAKRDLLEVTADLGHFPSQRELGDRGMSMLAHAVWKHHGGMYQIARRLGFPPPRRERGYWQKWENVADAFEAMIELLGHYPTARDILKFDPGLINTTRTYHGGLVAVRIRLGYGPVTDERIAEHADTIARIVPTLGLTDTSVLWDRLKTEWVERDLKAGVEDFERDGSVTRFRALLDD